LPAAVDFHWPLAEYKRSRVFSHIATCSLADRSAMPQDYLGGYVGDLVEQVFLVDAYTGAHTEKICTKVECARTGHGVLLLDVVVVLRLATEDWVIENVLENETTPLLAVSLAHEVRSRVVFALCRTDVSVLVDTMNASGCTCEDARIL